MDKRLREASRWLRQARRDLDAAKHSLSGGDYEWCAFMCQQAAEKAVKGGLYSLGRVETGHSVRRLLEAFSAASGVPMDELASCAKELDRHYIASRYPNAWSEGAPFEYYDREIAERCVRCAERLIRKISEYVKTG